jgi:uncharacterized delta-60 repeat protein
MRFHARLLSAAALMALAAATPAIGAPGDLDPTFGSSGKRLTAFSRSVELYSVALQPDGKIVAAGTIGDEETGDFALARYRPDGTLDRSFSRDGKVIVAFGPGSDQAHAVAVQPDGRIVAVGYVQSGSDYDLALVRFLPNGRLDRTFDGDGKVRTSVADYAIAHAVALQPDGKIVVGATVRDAPFSFAAFRYRPNGSLDSGFGPAGNGRVVTSFGPGTSGVAAVILQPDRKIVLAGGADVGGNRDFALARYFPNGALDVGFGSGGKVTTPIGAATFEYATSVALQADSKIVAAGETQGGENSFALVRYTASGVPDPSFGTDGKVTTSLAPGYDTAGGVAVQPNGMILAAGYTVLAPGRFGIVRYTTAGTLDPSFGTGGIVTPTLGPGSSTAKAIDVRPDGRILVGGYASGTTGFSSFALAQILGAYPTIRIGNVSRPERDRGTAAARVPVRLSLPPGASPVAVRFTTVDGSASSPRDFLARSGTLRFSGRRTVRWIAVPVVGDRRDERRESFRVSLFSAKNATLADAWGTVTIRDDD